MENITTNNPTPKILKINTGTPTQGTTIRPFEIYKLVDENDPILRTPTKHFDFTKPPMNPVHLAMSLFETMFALKGVGLTANQVGVPWSVFVVGSDQNNKQVFFNPKIISMTIEKESMTEGCLSFPHLVLKVARPISIEVEYQHVNGEVRTTKFDGVTARIVLHEFDHTQGIVFSDLIPEATLMIANEKRRKLKKKIARR